MKLLQHVNLTHTNARIKCILLPGFPAPPAVTTSVTPTGAVYRRHRRGTLHVQSCTDTEYEIADVEHGVLESSCVPYYLLAVGRVLEDPSLNWRGRASFVHRVRVGLKSSTANMLKTKGNLHHKRWWWEYSVQYITIINHNNQNKQKTLCFRNSALSVTINQFHSKSNLVSYKTPVQVDARSKA